MTATYATFLCYLLLMVGIGIYFCKRAANSVEDYLLGGRGMGSWVTAFSAQASDMSGWLLMGLPGAVYLFGLNQIWIAVGLALGTLANWLFVAPRLRTFTEATRALTISTFLGERYADPTRLIRLLSAALTLFFFTIYAASGLVSAGKLFNWMFAMPYTTAVLIGAAVMIFYTLLGGFLAVCWTDLIQGVLMLFAVVALPLIAFQTLEPGALDQALITRNLSMNLLPEGSLAVGLFGVFSTAAWGFGYFGQPHILSRFMSIKSVRLLPRATTIAMIWVVISLSCAVLIGLAAVPIFPELPPGDHEKVFIMMIGKLVFAGLSGVLLAAILAAVMSTIDSQLLASSSTLISDIYVYLLHPKAGEKEQMWISRGCVLLISIIACVLALKPGLTIFGLVQFAWGGLGTVFGPAVLAALFWRKSSYAGILAGMICGTAVLLLWYAIGHNNIPQLASVIASYPVLSTIFSLYEIVPGMLANVLCIWIFSRIFPAAEPVQKKFDALLADFRTASAGENR